MFRTNESVWGNLSTEELKNILGAFFDYMVENEESMTEKDADEHWERYYKLKRYIETVDK